MLIFKKIEQPNHRGLITESEYKSIEMLLFQIRIKDTNSPSAPKKPLLSISFWGSLRIEALVQSDSEKFIDKIINYLRNLIIKDKMKIK